MPNSLSATMLTISSIVVWFSTAASNSWSAETSVDYSKARIQLFEAKNTNHAALSHDGKQLLICRRGEGKGQAGARLLETATGKELHSFKVPEDCAVQGIFMPDGKSVCIAPRGQPLLFFDLATSKLTASLDTRGSVNAGVQTVTAIAPGGSLLCYARPDGDMSFWNIPDRRELGHVEGHRIAATRIEFSSDGTYMASIERERKGQLILWTVDGFRKQVLVKDADPVITGLAFAPDGKTLFAVDCDACIRCWSMDPLTEKPKQVLANLTYVEGLACSPHATHFALASRRQGAFVYEARTGKITALPKPELQDFSPTDVIWGANDSAIVARSNSGAVVYVPPPGR
jgi:WD40 repeat protein